LRNFYFSFHFAQNAHIHRLSSLSVCQCSK